MIEETDNYSPLFSIFNNMYNVLICSIYTFYLVKIANGFKNTYFDIKPTENEYDSEYDLSNENYLFTDLPKGKIINHTPYFILDEDISDEIKLNLLDLLSLNSIDRCYILYFIFKKHDECQIINTDDKLINVNSYNEFKIRENTYGKSNFNLDETLEPNIKFTFNDTEYNVNFAHINVISWLYYSGIYDYLFFNECIKYEILNEMNKLKLLYGNLFLKYQIFLLKYEAQIDGNIVNDKDNDNDMKNIKFNAKLNTNDYCKESNSQPESEVEESETESELNISNDKELEKFFSDYNNIFNSDVIRHSIIRELQKALYNNNNNNNKKCKNE
jgi:hypothetical protein